MRVAADAKEYRKFLKWAQELPEDKRRELPIDGFVLSTRVSNALNAGNVTTIGKLIWHTEGDLLQFKNLGRLSLKELKELVYFLGFEFGERNREAFVNRQQEG